MTSILNNYGSVQYSSPALRLMQTGWTFPKDVDLSVIEGTGSLNERLEQANSAIAAIEQRITTSAGTGEDELLHNIAWLPLIQLRQQLAAQAFKEMPRTKVEYDEATQVINDILRAAIRKKTGSEHNPVNRIEGFADEVALVTACLLDAEGQEHATHGVSRILTYAQAILDGKIKTDGVVTLEHETPGKLSFNGGGTFGQVAVQMALQGALNNMDTLPDDSALMVTMKNASHAGRLEWILRQATRKGYHSFALFNVDGKGRTAPFGGAESRLGTNPIAMGVSTGIDQDGIVGDSATTAWAEGAVRIAYLNNLTVPLDVLTTPDGEPTIHPAGVYKEGGPPDLLLPIGGDVAAYKGSVFGQMVKLLVDATSGRKAGNPVGTPGHNNLLLVLNKGDQSSFTTVADNAAYLRNCPPKPGHTVHLPGVGGLERLGLARQNGLKIATGTWEKVLELHRKVCA